MNTNKVVKVKFDSTPEKFTQELSKALGVREISLNSCGHDYYKMTYVIPKNKSVFNQSSLYTFGIFKGEEIEINKSTLKTTRTWQ